MSDSPIWLRDRDGVLCRVELHFEWLAEIALECLLDEHEAAITFAATACTEEMDSTYWELTYKHDRLRRELGAEQLQRTAAQNGLTPYVYALQAFNQWVGQQPGLASQLEPIMRKLGIWGVEVGYDPNKDLATSIVSPDGPASRQGMKVLPPGRSTRSFIAAEWKRQP
jgi:hypothetical protein